MPDAAPDWARALWPTGNRALLLQALFHRDRETARGAWTSWEAAVDFDDVDWADIRVLPAMRRRWAELGIDSPNAGRIDGMHRFVWTRTQLLIQETMPLLRNLADAGIPVLLIKGCARALSDLPSRTERVTSDVDIVFRRSDLRHALDVVDESGWSCPWDLPLDAVHGLLRLSRHSLPYRRHDQEFDLLDIHASALFANRCLDHDDRLWERSREVRFRGVPLRIPDPVDQLIIACAHGVFFEFDPKPLDWVADCADILAAPELAESAEFWDAVVTETGRRGLYPNVYAGLSFLSFGLCLPVPDRVLDTLASNARQPFIAECASNGATVDATAASERRARGDAFVARAEASVARLSGAADKPKAGPAPVAPSEWLTAEPLDAARLSMTAPPTGLVEAARAAGADLTLALRGSTPGRSRKHPTDIAVTAMEMHPVELGRWHITKPILSAWWKTGFRIAPALFLACDMDRVMAEITDPGSVAALPVEECGFRLRYRWQLAPERARRADA